MKEIMRSQKKKYSSGSSCNTNRGSSSIGGGSDGRTFTSIRKKGRLKGVTSITLLLPALLLVVFLLPGFTSCSQCSGGEETAASGGGVEKTEPAEETKADQEEETAAVEDETVFKSTEETLSKGLISYYAGEVYVTDGGGERPAEIGEEVGAGATVSTMESSTCEIQFGNAAVVRLQENTVLQIDSLLSKEGDRNIKLTDKQGSVLSKVEKLAKGEKFGIKTQSMVCGVRGTQFVVTEVPEKETVLAVKEGKVAVLPSSLDTEGFEEALEVDADTAEKVSAKVDELAPVITDNRQLVIPFNKVAEIETKAREIVQDLAQKMEEETAEPEEIEVPQEVQDKVRAIFKASDIEDDDVQADSAEFASLTTMKPLPLPETGEEGSFKRVSITVTPPEASIFINGSFSGKTKAEALFPPDTTVAVEAFLEGYQRERLEIPVRLDGESAFSMSLTPEDETEETGDTAEAAEEVVEPVDVTFILNPAGAALTVNGSTVPGGEISGGRYTGSFMPGETITVAASAEGYNTKSARVTVGETSGQRVNLTLTKTIAGEFPASSSAIVGTVEASGGTTGLVIMADRYGVVSGFTQGGNLQWSVPTSNSPNENSPPVVLNGKVYFSGANEFVIIRADSGDVLHQEILSAEKKHAFGRRVAGYGSSVVYPVNGGLLLLNGSDGSRTKSITFPGGSRMTPAVKGSKAYLVNQEGEFLEVDLGSGEVTKTVATSAVQPIATQVKFDGSRAYFVGRNGTVVCIDTGSGSVVWEKRLEASRSVVVTSDLEVGGNGVYVFANGRIYGLSAASGNQLFSPLGGASGPPTYHAGYIIFGTVNKGVEVRNARSSTLVSGKNIDDLVSTRPKLIEDKLYIGTQSGKIFTLNTKDWL